MEHVVDIAKIDPPEESELTGADFEAHYPCGKGDEAHVVCADPNAAPDRSARLMIMYKTTGTIPHADSVNHYILGFAFDVDNVEDNNFVPPDAEAGDYFGHTDK